MATVTIKSYRKEREREITNNLEKALGRVGAIVENQAKRNVTKTGSEHPQVQTGRLRSSITHKTEPNMVSIGTNVEYGKYLEFGTSRMSPYPWLFPAVEMRKSDIIETLKGKFSIT